MATLTPVLNDAKAAWRVNAMLRAMAGDYLFREQFATDPLQVFCDYVMPQRGAAQPAEAASQLLFAVFSNADLRRWMGGYARCQGGRPGNRAQFVKQFAQATAAARDPLVALALMRGAASGEGSFALVTDFLAAIVAAMGRAGQVASGTEMSPGVTATEMSPGATATEMSPGTIDLAGRIAAEVASAVRFAGELRRLVMGSGTEMSPGQGTEHSPGGTELSPGHGNDHGGTEMSPGGTEMSPGHGTERSPGALRLSQSLAAAVGRAESLARRLATQSGTDMSPGPGTDMSPGPGTDMSPGRGGLAGQLFAEIRIASRLVATLLAAEGTEMSPGGGTEMSPGHGTEMSPGGSHVFDALAAALRRAELFSVELGRSADGTNMSPGTATNMSPGITATEISPGIDRVGIAERLQAELASATRFGAELLRESGGTEMSPGGGTEMSPGALRLQDGLVRAVLDAERLGRLLVRAEGTEMSPGTATEMSPGVTATEMSPGARVSERLVAEIAVAARYAKALQAADGGTEMSPGGTEMSPGGGTEMSPGGNASLVRLLAASIRRAQLFLAESLRTASGTEMSPGTATEMSPGVTATNMSPGALPGGVWGTQLPAQIAVPLGALVQYAVALRRQGALDVSGLELG